MAGKRGPKLSKETVEAIKEGLDAHIEGSTLAAALGTTPSAVSRVKHGSRHATTTKKGDS